MWLGLGRLFGEGLFFLELFGRMVWSFVRLIFFIFCVMICDICVVEMMRDFCVGMFGLSC